MASIEEDFEEGEWPFGGEGDADDVPVPVGTSCVKISEMLASADEKAGEYSFGGRADTLPVAPGLRVNEVGTISLPLGEEQAEKLIARCEKSPFGHNLDTKMDENVRKSWQLAPDQVEIDNTQWNSGLEKLTEIIARRLGYEGVPMQCVLYKLLVYGEGGHFAKHQDTEKEDGMIATLVIQLPSTHEGGDLVIYRGGKERYRHDFGKADGTAAYFPHYAVHYADAEHSVEKVTKGYRLVLVYSLCLPSTMRHLERDSNAATSDDLADAIAEMEQGDESFALLLSHEYTKKSITSLGSGALKGIDSARFRALEEANAAVPSDKKVNFFLVKLVHKIVSCPEGIFESNWQEAERKQAIHWYSSTGEDLGRCVDTKLAVKLSFLNPGQETFTQRWEPHGNSNEEAYTGNEGPTRNTKYDRYAIVAWPATRQAENALKFMSAELAVEALLSRRPVGAADLGTFLDAASKKLGAGKKWHGADKASVRFCRSFCELLVEAGDVALAKLFFTKYCPRLGMLRDNTTLVPVLQRVVRTFDWNEIGEALLDVLGNETLEYSEEEEVGDHDVELTLQVLDGLDDGDAQQALLKMAVENFLKLEKDGGDLDTSKVVGPIWKHAFSSGDRGIFDMLVDHFKSMKPSELGPMLEVTAQYAADLDEEDDKFKALAEIAISRMEWLKEEIERLDKPFSWNMPRANFPDKTEIQQFLRGPEISMKTEGLMTFSGLPEARKYAAKCVRESQKDSSFTMKPAGKGKSAYVTIKKTRKWFDECQKRLTSFQVELEKLKGIYERSAKESAKKKRRVE